MRGGRRTVPQGDPPFTGTACYPKLIVSLQIDRVMGGQYLFGRSAIRSRGQVLVDPVAMRVLVCFHRRMCAVHRPVVTMATPHNSAQLFRFSG